MHIKQEVHGRVAIVFIDRPEARGAVNPEMAQDLYSVFLGIDEDDGIDVAILAGTGGHFCAGFDLKAATTDAARHWIDRVDIPEDWTDALAVPLPGPMGPSRLMLRKPVIAAIEGHAVAGGLELAAWCDMRVVSDAAVMGVYCRRWGVPLIDGGTVRLPRIVGQGRANDLILTGRPVGASEAIAMGLADRQAQEGHALDEAIELAHALTRFPQMCMRADHLSARMDGLALASALRREWQSAAVFAAEGVHGASRFASGKGRGGNFDAI